MCIRDRYELENIDLEKTKEEILFRIIQESITNALRHGHATEVHIHLYQENHFLYLKIQDNGIGCDHVHYGFGLTQMRERLAVINGQVEFDGHHGFLTIAKICLLYTSPSLRDRQKSRMPSSA